MAVWARPCTVFPCLRKSGGFSRNSRNGMIKSTFSIIKTQICTIGLSLTLINSVRLPREAFRYGAIPYLVVYSLWLLVAGVSTSLLQLASGQLSQQDAVGVWRAVPILRGVGHIQLITSYLSCVYNMVYAALAVAYIMWITKDTFPLRICTKLQMTPTGYENKINASECFSATFLSPITQHPEYMGIMAIIVFFLWCFLPLLLYGQAKSLKLTMSFLAPLTILSALILSIFLSRDGPLQSLLVSCEQWSVYADPYIWFSGLVQALLSMQIANGFLISAGGTLYMNCDVRWVSVSILSYNLLTGWLWVLLWQAIGGDDEKDTSFISVLTLIYQSSMSEKRAKLWPLLAYAVILLSGIMTILILLYPIYDRLHRLTGDKWKLIAGTASVLGTALTLAVLIEPVEVTAALDDFVVPALVVFSTTLQVVGLVFIYGCCHLKDDLKFLTGYKTVQIWMVLLWITPALLIGITGWWLKAVLRQYEGVAEALWPLGGVFVCMLVVMAVMAAVAVAKEEQYNLLSKIASAFHPSRLWGPEDPTVRYNWMTQRFENERLGSEEVQSIDSFNNFTKTVTNKTIHDYNEWPSNGDTYQRPYDIYPNDIPFYPETIYPTYIIPQTQQRTIDSKFCSPNICIASDKLDSRLDCNCNRHFTLNVPHLKSEITTSL